MKKGIHPESMETLVTCACGNTFTVKSNKKEMHIEVCSQCHPQYTGEQRGTKKTGNVEKFNRKYGIEK
ncbi:MAG: 50S ribosomal protein L31 [Bacilli bacterium]|nr:50S ribosomal protein L31 [Bacilli bacterium]